MTMNQKKFWEEKSFWINIIAIVFIFLSWEFLFANQGTMDAISLIVEQLTGWDPRLHALSPMATPRPSRIANILTNVPPNGRGGWAYFQTHAASTLTAAVFGFFIGNGIAVLLAVLFVYIKPLERTMMPPFLIMRSIPLAAITPLLLRIRFTLADMPVVQESEILHAVFGTDVGIKMLIVVIIVFFPTMINTHAGLKSISPSEIELMKSLNASEWDIFWKARIFTAMPLTFAALKIASASSVLAVTMAEWLGSNHGLGYIMSQGSSASLDSRHVWASILIITLVGLIFYWAVSMLEKIFIPWHESVLALKQAMSGQELDTLPEPAAAPAVTSGA
ncbi:MAG: ABC transporter permease [Anaerolineales bacterium]|nr:ABC transporter permease [Anaerolineales bacterium]